MKNLRRLLLLPVTLSAALGVAQTPNTPFQHVIVVVQENRTPDNLFGSSPTFEPGVNVSAYGLEAGSRRETSAARNIRTAAGAG